MTREEAIEILSRPKSMKGVPAEILMAHTMAIASLEAWEKVRQEINDLFEKPAFYMPNYDAYKMFLEIIDKHLQEVRNENTD